MIYVYITQNTDKQKFLNDVLLRHTTAPINILKGENGKPYLKGNPVYFNITHSGGYIAAAVSRSPVGVDMEVYGRGIRRAVLSGFSETEQSEIKSEKDFLTHWTAREAYIKHNGGTLAHMLKLTAFTGGKLYCNGTAAEPCPRFYYYDDFVLAVCGEGEIKISRKTHSKT